MHSKFFQPCGFSFQNPWSSESILLLSILQPLKNKSFINKFNNAFKACYKLYFLAKLVILPFNEPKGRTSRIFWNMCWVSISKYILALECFNIIKVWMGCTRSGDRLRAVTLCTYKMALLVWNVSDRLLQKYCISLRICIWKNMHLAKDTWDEWTGFDNCGVASEAGAWVSVLNVNINFLFNARLPQLRQQNLHLQLSIFAPLWSTW